MVSKKDLIKVYVDQKKELSGPSKKLYRDAFIKSVKASKYQINKHFGNWKEFQMQGDEAYQKTLTVKQRALLSEYDKSYDPNASSEDCIEDLRLIQKLNWGMTITRNFYRSNGSYSDSTWNQFFGTFQEFRRQSGLELNRHQARLEKGIARQASVDHYREFFEKEVIPYYLKYEKESHPFHIKTIMAMSDLHDKDVSRFSLSLFIEACRLKQPDVIVLNGDIYDLLEFGKYSVDPRSYDIKARFDFVREHVFKPLRRVCPNTQIDLIAGNHEMRLLKLLADVTPNVRVLLSDVMGITFSDIFGLDEFQINWASKFDLGAYSNADIKNEIKKNYRVYFNSFIFSHHPDSRLLNLSGSNGHHHSGKINSYNSIDPLTALVKRSTWSQTPGMCQPDAQYLNNLSGWNTGFLEVVINIKTLEVIQKIHFTYSDWAIIDGRYYVAKDFL